MRTEIAWESQILAGFACSANKEKSRKLVRCGSQLVAHCGLLPSQARMAASLPDLMGDLSHINSGMEFSSVGFDFKSLVVRDLGAAHAIVAHRQCSV